MHSQDLTLADAGKSPYKIFIAKNAGENEVSAAEEFQKNFKTITGIQLPILQKDNFQNEKLGILIGSKNRFQNLPAVEQDGVIIQTQADNLILSGGSRKGVLYSVYTFFENYLGLQFFALDEIKIPKKNTVKIATVNYHYSPPFSFRSYYSLENGNKNYADFHKQNYFFENRLYPAHSLAWLLPAEKYFAGNPEFFALMDGKRNPSQICFSSEGALKELIRVLKIEMSLTPNQVWSVSHLDTPKSCECALCQRAYKKGNGFSETLIPFVNKVAKAFPEKTISTLAYNQSIFPSKLVKPEKNVEIMFCFTNTDRRYPLLAPQNKESKKHFEALEMWKKQTNNFFIWDYSVNYYHSLYPFPNIHTFQKDVQYFRNEGFQKIFMQGIGPQKGEFSELKSFIASRLLWNPEADYIALRDDFLKNYYGNAWIDIKTYLLLLEEEAKKHSTPLNEYASPTIYKNGYLNRSNISKYKSLLSSAFAKVENEEKYANRVKRELLSIEYADLEILSEQYPNLSAQSKADYKRNLKNFQAEAKKNKIEKLRNGEFTVEEFINQKLK